MVAAGIALIILGYSFLYSGSSNLMTGGKGIGFLQAITGKGMGGISGSIGTVQRPGNDGNALGGGIAALMGSITPQGNAGSTPQQSGNTSPVASAEQI